MKQILTIALTFASITGLSIIAQAQAEKPVTLASLKCEATGFRAGLDPDDKNNGILWVHVVKQNDQVYLKEYGGHLYVVGYYGSFRGENLVEVPYKRAVKYTNHFKFENFDAVYTAGHESGMWGDFVINKDIVGSRGKTQLKFDAHYIFQAGDHLGGTIDYECRSEY